MEATHVMSFAGTGSWVESITLCGIEPGHVDQVTVHKGQLELVHEPTLTPDDGPPIPAGLVLANRARMLGRAGMRIDFGDEIAVRLAGAPIVLQAWVSAVRAGAQLQVVVTYRPDR